MLSLLQSTLSTLWNSLTFWKTAFLLLALLNAKNLPLVWHMRVYRYFFANGYLLTPAATQPRRALSLLTAPVSLFTRAPLLELDFNMHKSNSTYFSDLDVSRTALMSALVVKGAALLDERMRKAAPPKKGPLGFILGSVYANFKREIPAYVKYEVRSHVASFDRKWIYIVTYFLEPGKGKKAEKMRTVYAVCVSKYVLKKGRYTVPPREAFEAAGFEGLKKGSEHEEEDGVVVKTGAENGNGHGDVNGDAVKRGGSSDGDEGEEEWNRLKKEVDQGMKVMAPFIELEEKLMEDFDSRMGQ